MNSELLDWISLATTKATELGWLVNEYGEIDGFPLVALSKMSDSEYASAPIYVSAGMHGDEPAGPMALLELLLAGEFCEKRNWLLVPMINPVGMGLQTRENGEGLDLNRDYKKFKSYEAKVHAEWFEKQQIPQLALSLHEDWETTGYYFYEINQGCGDTERTRALLTSLDQSMKREPMLVIDDHQVREPGWIYHAAEADEPGCWPEAIYLASKGVPISLTMETPSSLDLRERIDLQKAFVRHAVDIFADSNG